MDTAAVMGAIREAGLRVTPQRMAVAEYMGRTRSHPSAEEVHQAVRKILPMVSLSTIYKTLDLLRERGMVSEVATGSGSRYDGRNVPHINLVCERCGRIEDVEGEFVHDLLHSVADSTEYAVNGCFEMRGRCGRCRARR
jgi:Fe2+ or Zn2+ uptake regulation protein